MIIDVNTFLGHHPFRRLDGGSPAAIVAGLERVGIDQAWISNLAAVFWRDPTEGNRIVYQAATHHVCLRPVPAVHPGLPGWIEVLEEAVDRESPCVRVDPISYGIAPSGSEMLALVRAAAERNLPLQLAVRLEDSRQRHPNDLTGELPAWAVRALIRSHPEARLIVTHADRDLIEQVHFGSTPDEASRILWDICWLWGPPEDQLQLLVTTIGAGRFCFGTGMPLRIPESSIAKLELTELTPTERRAIESSNARLFARS
ncbi:MAG: hypothetical protein FJ206_05565 [Gemmatimonadetes bacterium]|nr:hypothetical protein [Gemmatimonadota bacterium]